MSNLTDGCRITTNIENLSMGDGKYYSGPIWSDAGGNFVIYQNRRIGVEYFVVNRCWQVKTSSVIQTAVADEMDYFGFREKANLLRFLLENNCHYAAQNLPDLIKRAVSYEPRSNQITIRFEGYYRIGPFTFESVYPAWQCLEKIATYDGWTMSPEQLHS